MAGKLILGSSPSSILAPWGNNWCSLRANWIAALNVPKPLSIR